MPAITASRPRSADLNRKKAERSRRIVIRLASADERPPVVRLADPPEPLVIGRGLSADGTKAGFTAFSETRPQSEFRSSGLTPLAFRGRGRRRPGGWRLRGRRRRRRARASP